ncbi:MAG: SufD family Fe-S cluster assembly protein [archaeon]|nr:SufD family Fe-S cluster assembly protein [archaeon]
MNYELRIKNEQKLIPFIWINGKEKEINVNVNLKGNDSNAHIIGIFLGTLDNSIIFNTNVVHTGKNTFSRIDIRAVFLGHSIFSSDGMIHIAKGARGADGYFTSKVLLFDDARGRSVPSLEIDENELKAGHASTIGRPDENQLFYMKARGIPEKEAYRLIIEGFFEPVLKFFPRVKQDSIRKKLIKLINVS